jgi:hypothetical protein
MKAHKNFIVTAIFTLIFLISFINSSCIVGGIPLNERQGYAKVTSWSPGRTNVVIDSWDQLVANKDLSNANYIIGTSTKNTISCCGTQVKATITFTGSNITFDGRDNKGIIAGYTGTGANGDKYGDLFEFTGTNIIIIGVTFKNFNQPGIADASLCCSCSNNAPTNSACGIKYGCYTSGCNLCDPDKPAVCDDCRCRDVSAIKFNPLFTPSSIWVHRCTFIQDDYTGGTESMRFMDSWAGDVGNSDKTVYIAVSFCKFIKTNQNFDVASTDAQVFITAHHNGFYWSGGRSPKSNGINTNLHSFNNYLENFISATPMQAHGGSDFFDEFSQVSCDSTATLTNLDGTGLYKSCNNIRLEPASTWCLPDSGGLGKSAKTRLLGSASTQLTNGCTNSFSYEPCSYFDYFYKVQYDSTQSCSDSPIRASCKKCISINNGLVRDFVNQYAGADTGSVRCELPGWAKI